jgi:hypothetical protein
MVSEVWLEYLCVICPDCHGSNVFCEACSGSGIAYCCDGENVDMAPFTRDEIEWWLKEYHAAEG